MTLSAKTPKKHDVSDLKCKNDRAFFCRTVQKIKRTTKQQGREKRALFAYKSEPFRNGIKTQSSSQVISCYPHTRNMTIAINHRELRQTFKVKNQRGKGLIIKKVAKLLRSDATAT